MYSVRVMLADSAVDELASQPNSSSHTIPATHSAHSEAFGTRQRQHGEFQSVSQRGWSSTRPVSRKLALRHYLSCGVLNFRMSSHHPNGPAVLLPCFLKRRIGPIRCVWKAIISMADGTQPRQRSTRYSSICDLGLVVS